MALEDIVKRIKEKASQEVEKIREEADKERGELIKRAEEEAAKIKDKILKRLEKEGEEEKREKLIRTRSEERKKILALKRELMDETFRQAEQIFSNLDREEYLSSLKRSLLSSIDSGNEEIIISSRDKELIEESFIEKLKKELKKKGKEGELRFSPTLGEKERGFILKKEEMQINCTFSSLFSSLKDELEIEIAKKLFKG